MMFSLSQIDARIAMFNATADDADVKCAETLHPAAAASLAGAAYAFREAAKSLERMVADEIEREAREVLR
jgi:hypothetical protein